MSILKDVVSNGILTTGAFRTQDNKSNSKEVTSHINYLSENNHEITRKQIILLRHSCSRSLSRVTGQTLDLNLQNWVSVAGGFPGISK